MKINVINKKGENTGRVFTLDENIFNNKSSQNILRQAIHVHMVNTRTGTAKTKDRAEVSGTGKKPWGNNKMGMARTGDKRTPIFVHGGVSHGPVPMNYSLSMPKKMKVISTYLALTQGISSNKIFIIENFNIESERLTKEAFSILSDLKKNTNIKLNNAIIYFESGNQISFKRAFRNINGIKIESLSGMHAYDLMVSSDIIIFESVMEKLNKSKAKNEVKVTDKKDVDSKATVKKIHPKVEKLNNAKNS